MATVFRPCPSCKEVGKLHLSRSRNKLEKILSATKLMHYYRCHNCNWRGVLFRRKKIQFSFSGMIKTIILLFFIYYFVMYVLKNYTN